MILKRIKEDIKLLKNPRTDIFEIKNILLKDLNILIGLLAIPALFVAMVEAVHFSHFYTVGFYAVIALVYFGNFIFYKILSYRQKTIHILFGLYLIATHNFLIWGISGAAIPLLILFCILATLLLGFENGLLAIFLSVIPLVVAGFFMVRGTIVIAMDVLTMSTSVISWLTAASVLVVIALICVVSFGMIEYNLINANNHIKHQAEELNKINHNLNQDIAKRKVVEDKLRKRINTTLFLTKISNRFINIKSKEIKSEIEHFLKEYAMVSGFNSVFIAVFSETLNRYDDFLIYSQNPSGLLLKEMAAIHPTALIWNKKDGLNIEGFYVNSFSELTTAETKISEYSNYLVIPMTYQENNIGFFGIKKNKGELIDLDTYSDLMILKDLFTNVIIQEKFQDEKAKMHEQLVQSQKLESIGNLTAGIAHDFNNLLTVILGNSEILYYRNEPKNTDHELLKDIMDAAMKAAELTNKMLLFSRKQVLDFKAVNLTEMIMDLEKILQRLIGEQIRIATELDENLPRIMADKSNLEQVILNICANCRDAMPLGGELKIRTRAIDIVDEDLLTIPNAKKGHWVLLEIEDTGTGIEESIIPKIFDPFFTTKEVGKGTGMGLSVVYGIVKKHKGWINVNSEIGKGSCFSLYFPVTKIILTQETKPQKSNPVTRKRTERILLIEDNPAVLEFTKKLLESHGFAVDIAINGSQAEEYCIEKNFRYDIIISDIILPDINGMDLLMKFKDHCQEVKVLMMSGYVNDSARQKIVDSNHFHFIKKPFQKDDFIEKIVTILDTVS